MAERSSDSSSKKIDVSESRNRSQSKPYNLLFKVVIVGDSGTGKTSLIQSYVNKGVDLNHMNTTVGVEFSSKNFVKEDGKVVRAQFWDTAGSERYHTLTRSYYRGAVAAFIVYDVSDL